MEELSTHLAKKNEFVVSGYLADEPKTGNTKNKMLFVTIKLMQNNRRRVISDTGGYEWTEEKPSVFFVNAFDTQKYQMASKVLKHCHKGTYVLCKCQVKPESWQDIAGNWQNRTRFTMQELIVANNKSGLEKENAELQLLLDYATTPEMQSELNPPLDDTMVDMPDFFDNEYL